MSQELKPLTNIRKTDLLLRKSQAGESSSKISQKQRVIGVADVSGSQFRRLQAHLLRIGGKSHQSIPAVLHHKAADVHRFICLRVASLTLGVSGHKHSPSLEETKVYQQHPGQPYLVQKTLFAGVIQYRCTRTGFAAVTALPEAHIYPIYKPYKLPARSCPQMLGMC